MLIKGKYTTATVMTENIEDAAEAVASNIPLLFEAVEALNISPDEDVRIDDSFIRQYLLKSCIELALVDFS